jgi:hypothetical protein
MLGSGDVRYPFERSTFQVSTDADWPITAPHPEKQPEATSL